MSVSINKVTLVGHIGKDPRFIDDHEQVAVFSVATNENYQDKRGQWQKSTEWHKVKVRGPLADRAVRSLRKGHLVYIEGKFKSWRNQAGVIHWEVMAFKCNSLEKPPPEPFDDSTKLLGPEPVDTYPKTPWGNPKQ